MILFQATISETHSFKPLYIVKLIRAISDALWHAGAVDNVASLEAGLRNMQIWHIAVIPNEPHPDFADFYPYDNVRWEPISGLSSSGRPACQLPSVRLSLSLSLGRGDNRREKEKKKRKKKRERERKQRQPDTNKEKVRLVGCV